MRFISAQQNSFVLVLLLLLFALLVTAASKATAAGADIVIGQTIALSGGNAQHGSSVVKGVDTYLESINAKGGIHGRKIRLIREDDGGDSKRASENTLKLIEKEHVIAMFSGIEGGPCVASMNAATPLKVPVIGCAAGSPELREPYNRYSFPIRAAHFNEFAKLIDVSLSYGYKRIAFMHADSETGRKHLTNVKRLLGERQTLLTLPIVIGSKTTPQEVVQQLKDNDINVVFNHGSAGFYGKVVEEAQKQQIKTAFFAVNSGAQQMVQSLGSKGRGIIFTQVVPYPWGVTPKIVSEYQAAFKKKYPDEDYSFSSLEGYINAVVLVAGLRKAGKPYNSEAVTAAFENLGLLNIGGLEVKFDVGNHEGSRFIDTVVVSSSGKFVR